MLSGLDAIEISSEYESPIWPMDMEEEIMSMSVGSRPFLRASGRLRDLVRCHQRRGKIACL